MSGADSEQDGAAQAPAHLPKLRLIRVKRKRDAEAPDDLVVEGLAAPGKRLNTSLSGVMAGLGLGPADSGSPAASGTDVEAASEAQPARRVRYRKLSTLSAAQLGAMDQQRLHSLVVSSLQQQQQHEAGHRSSVKATAAPAASAERAAQRLQAGRAARYEHIRRRRGLTCFAITEQSPDPLARLADVCDVVRLEGPPAGSDPAGAAAGALSPWQQQQQRQQQRRGAARPSRAAAAAARYDEGTLLCNYLPMVRRYLREQGRDLGGAEEQLGGDPGGAERQQGGQAGAPAASQAGDGQGAAAAAAAAMEGVEAGGEEAEGSGEYVYDLYAAAEEEPQGEAQEEGWWELHASGRAPVVQILEDDSWVVLEQSDVDDSDADSEDSNAEGFYAHDYPEEPSDASSDDGGHDPEGAVFGGGRRRHGWDSDSYGSGDEY